MNQMKPGAIVRILSTNELGTIVRHSKISDVKTLSKIERDAQYYGHFMVITTSGVSHIHISQLKYIWSPDQGEKNDARK